MTTNVTFIKAKNVVFSLTNSTTCLRGNVSINRFTVKRLRFLWILFFSPFFSPASSRPVYDISLLGILSLAIRTVPAFCI
jgi:hypothetical protein